MTIVLTIQGYGNKSLVGFDRDNHDDDRDDEDESSWFPLTEEGCQELGEFLCDSNITDWMYSSSCDFPDEYKPNFDGDVRTEVLEAYKERAKERFPISDWKLEIANDDTLLGYNEWVVHKIESERTQ